MALADQMTIDEEIQAEVAEIEAREQRIARARAICMAFLKLHKP